MTKKLHDLEQLRLSKDWSYQDLTAAIFEATGYRRDADCWRRICQRVTKEPQGCTKHALSLFRAALATEAKLGARPERQRKSA